jgi:hypothetical protein
MSEVIKCGKFSFAGQSISGPAKYMREKGSAKIDSITSGNDAGFNAMMQVDPSADMVRLVMVALQTDYAGWIGMERFCAAHGIG